MSSTRFVGTLILLTSWSLLTALSAWAMRGPDGRSPADKHVVASTGEARIRVEIEVPKGTRSSEPELALVYSSVGQEGPFGFGWRLPLGEITRTTRFGTPNYDATDRFEFEGQLLVPDDPANPTEYRTITETFARIRPFGEAWEVAFPDGRIARFGTDEATRVRESVSGGIFRWLLSELEDVNGNVTLFSYAADPDGDATADPDLGMLYPVAVSYSYRDQGGSLALVGVERRVEFVYENRPDPIVHFRGGVETHLTRRVAEIRSVAGTESFRRMTFSYSAATDPYPTHRSRLASVQVYGADCPASELLSNCQAQPPQTFAYTEPYDEMGGGDHWDDNTLGPPVSFVHASRDAGVRIGDVDGDGRLDLVRAWIGQVDQGSEPPAPVQYQDVWLNRGGVWILDQDWTNALQAIEPGAVKQYISLTNAYACSAGTAQSESDRIAFSFTQNAFTDVWSRTPQDARLVDMNADGRVDIVLSVVVGAGKVDGDQCGGVEAEWAGTPVKGVWINNGSGWEYDPTLSLNLPTFTSTFVRTQTGGDYIENGAYQNAPGKCGGDHLINHVSNPTDNHSSVWFRDSHGVRFADLNGDQRPDLIARRDDARGRTYAQGAWLNTENGWIFQPDYTPPVPLIGTFSYFADPQTGVPYERWVTDANTGVQVVDLNGDGLDDLVKTAIEPFPDPDGNLAHGPLSSAFTTSGVWLNTGSGWCSSAAGCPEAVKYLPPDGHTFAQITISLDSCVPNDPTGGAFELHHVVDSGLFYADSNGDGLLDLIQNDSDINGGAGRHAWLQSPGDSGSIWRGDESYRPPAGVEAYLWNGIKRTWQGVHFRDLDGNGTPDWIKKVDQNSFTRLSRSGHGDRMEIFANGRGGETQFSYMGATAQIDDARESRALSDPKLSEEPAGMPGSGFPLTFWRAGPVVSALTVRSLDDEYTTSFGYGHPRWCPVHRSSLGFRLVESGLDDGTEIRSFFWQDHGRAGGLSRRETYQGSSRVAVATYDWEVVDGVAVTGSLAGVFVGRITEESYHHEYGGNPSATLRVTRGYNDENGDEYGFNFVSELDSTRPTGHLHIARTPAPADLTNWIVQKVATEVATNSAGTVLRSREYRYVPGRGLLDQIREAVHPRGDDSSATLAITEWRYDTYGNPVERRDAEGRKTFFCYDGDTALGADDVCPARTTGSHTVLVGVLDPAGGLSELQSDLATGQVERLIQFNGDQTWLEPDAFGRPLKFWSQPASHASATLLEERFYVDDPAEDHGNTLGAVAGRPYVERFEEVGNGTDVFSAIYFDGVGREAWTILETPASASVTGRFGRARFRDHAGRLTRETYEIACTDVHCTNLADENLPGATGPAARVTYDGLGRLVTLETPEGTTVVARTQASRTQPAGPGTTDIFDVELTQQPDGVLTRRFLDGERIVWVEECPNQMDPPVTDPASLSCGPDPDATFYAYEPTGETASIYDAMANSMPGGHLMPQHRLVYHYDTLGRVIEIDDPDAGTSFTSYDLVGNVVATTNARGQQRSFEYDELDRLWRQTEPELANPYIITYDPITRRRQSVVSSSYYSSGYEYDDFGRLKRQTVNQLIMDFEYDLLGRPTRAIYPNTGDTAVTYDYAGAYLKRVCRSASLDTCISGSRSWSVEDVVYDELGRLSEVKQHVSTYQVDYDPSTYRLKKQTLVGDAGNLLDLTYSYLPGGNVQTITDAHVDKIPELDATADYSYDHRGRLKTATLLGSERTFDYDSLGNLTQRDAGSPNQSYQSLLPGDKPHAIMSRTVDGTVTNYEYDADGNMTRRGNQHLTYDAAGRLLCVGSSEGACDLLENRYDLDGVLFAEITPQGTREFFGDWFVINHGDEDRAETSIYGLGRRLAVATDPNAELRVATPVAWGIPLDPTLFGWAIAGGGSLLLLGLGCRAGVPQAFRARPATAGIAIVLVGCLLPHPAWAGGSPPPPGAGDAVRYYYQDHLGTDILVTNLRGWLVSRRVWEPFGRLEAEGVATPEETYAPPTEASSGRFTGQRVESSIGLYDFKARWYDPDSGRFLSVDPVLQGLADPQLHNAYGYVRNNPMNLTDPTGRCLPPSSGCTGGSVVLGTEEISGLTYTVTAESITPVSSGTAIGPIGPVPISIPTAGLATASADPSGQGPLPNQPQLATTTSLASQSPSVLEGLANDLASFDARFGTQIDALTFAVTLAGVSVGNPLIVGVGLGSRALLGVVRGALAARRFTAVERAVISEARAILNSPQLARGIEALKAGIDVDLKIGGRTILIRPGLSSSGMTLFGEGGFVIGRAALSSSSELGKTVLHELFRLRFSAQGSGVGVGLSAVETRAAFEFAERAIGSIR